MTAPNLNLSLQHWLKTALFNLMLIALIGVVMRYKILYTLLFVDQKHLLHAHSHFAFAGWISQALISFLVYYLSRHSGKDEFKRYRWLLAANLVTAYGMLISFPLQGYGLFSIIFSTLSIFVAYAFAIVFWRDLDKLPVKPLSIPWFKAALIFNAISSVGAFSLAYMMANKIIHQNWYLGAVYFFLHFQYNGWFFFACMGLLYEYLGAHLPDQKNLKVIFWLFAVACIPAYFLSALWMPIPLWVYIGVVIAAFLQTVGWCWLTWMVYKNAATFFAAFTKPAKYLFLLSALALTIKLFLQLGSTIPALSQFAFGFRPIVIGYLHLVLLGVLTIFIIGYIFSLNVFHVKKWTLAGCIIFTTGIILNEAGLMVQGLAAMRYIIVPYINEFLLGVAVVLFTGIAIISGSLIGQRNHTQA